MESDKKVGAVAKKASEGAGSLLKAARDEVSAINRGPKKDVEIPRIEEPAPQKEKLEIPPQLTAQVWMSNNTDLPDPDTAKAFEQELETAIENNNPVFMFEKKEYNIVEAVESMTEREGRAEGGDMAMPPELEDTYPNIPPEEMEAAKASQLPDDKMEDSYEEFILDEAISDRDQNYLLDVLEQDERLSTIFDRVMDVAVEFSGAGTVKGPGTGVSDSIPARLSDGEFVFTKKAVDQIGAENLQMMMDDAERAFDESNGKLQMQTGGKVSKDMMYNVFQGRPMKSYEVSDELRDAMIRANKMPGTR